MSLNVMSKKVAFHEVRIANGRAQWLDDGRTTIG
jgi:hypothetical protein